MKMPSLVARRLGRSRRREESSSAARKKFGRQAATVTAADEEGTRAKHLAQVNRKEKEGRVECSRAGSGCEEAYQKNHSRFPPSSSSDTNRKREGSSVQADK